MLAFDRGEGERLLVGTAQGAVYSVDLLAFRSTGVGGRASGGGLGEIHFEWVADAVRLLVVLISLM